EVSKTAGAVHYRLHHFDEAIRHWWRAIDLMPSDLSSAAILISAHLALADTEGARRAAEITLERAERSLGFNRNDGAAMGYSPFPLAALGRAEQAKERMENALLVDPDNLTMRYNFACALMLHAKDVEATLGLLGPYFASASLSQVNYAKIDPDF